MSRGINKQGRRRMIRRAPIVGDSATRHQHSTRLPSIEELKSAAMGRWPEIFHDAAGVPHEHLDGRGHPCIRCGGTDRFAAFKDVAQRGSVQCRSCFNRSTDPYPGDGIATLRWLLGCDTSTACKWLAGWLGLTNHAESRPPAPLRRSVQLQVTSGIDNHFGQFADDCHRAMQSAWWTWLENALSLPVAELRRLRVGWSAQHHATTWPMVDHDDNVVGVRLRCVETGKKWSLSGSKAGLFVPSDLRADIDRLFVTEGPTDCAAIGSIGFDAVGRPSCSGAVDYTAKLVRRLHPRECVIVADDDANQAGKRGAESLAETLVTVCGRVRIIYPPTGHKDARDWVRAGANADDVLTFVTAADVQSLTINSGVSR